MTPNESQDQPHQHCIFHAQYEIRILNLEEEAKIMRINLENLRGSTWSPTVISAIILFFGTLLTVLGGLAGVAMSIFAKAHGWG